MDGKEIERRTKKYPFTINKTIEDLIGSIENNLQTARYRLNNFVDAFKEEFPSDKPHDRATAEALTWALMDGPLLLYALDMNGSAIIELHGILEAFAGKDIVHILPANLKEAIESKVIRHCKLLDLALIIRDLGIWNKEDVKFIEKLQKLRNGVAHKNPKLISNVVCSGKEVSMLDIDSVMTDVNCIPLIIRTIKLLHKMASANV